MLAALTLVLIVALAAAAVGWDLFLKPDTKMAPGKPVELTIARGSGTQTIAEQLSSAGVVKNALMFRWHARQAGVDGKLKPGQYLLATGMPDTLVLEKLQKGPNIVYYDVPIPEGFNVNQIAARFAARTGVSEAEMLQLLKHGAPQFAAEHPYVKGAYGDSLEGYLFPKTYRIKKGTRPEKIVDMMLDQFDEEIATVDLSYAKSKNLTVADVVTIASIIEREVRLSKEYPLVSSVIYNRLKAGMRLQLDSTVFYFLPPGTKVIRKSDLQNPNPYNTYANAGLPPGPLASPGLRAIEAAAHPAKTKYYYYVLTGKDGSQTFTNSYSDFLKAVEVYRRTFGK